MKAQELDTREATCKWYAARDAAQRSYAASTHYSDSQKIRAERMKLALELAVAAKNIFVTFRQKFITVKLDKPVVRDRKMLRELEADWEQLGIVKLISPQGITYRIPKLS